VARSFSREQRRCERKQQQQHLATAAAVAAGGFQSSRVAAAVLRARLAKLVLGWAAVVLLAGVVHRSGRKRWGLLMWTVLSCHHCRILKGHSGTGTAVAAGQEPAC
jgi:hypothetical protein